MPFPAKTKPQVTAGLCKDPANDYKQKHTTLSTSAGREVSNNLFTGADIHGSLSFLRARSSTHGPVPFSHIQPQPLIFLAMEMSSLLQLWLFFLPRTLRASRPPSHTGQLAPSVLTCLLQTCTFFPLTLLFVYAQRSLAQQATGELGPLLYCTRGTCGSCLWLVWEPHARGKWDGREEGHDWFRALTTVREPGDWDQ